MIHIVFKDSRSMVTILIIMSDLQRRAGTELFKDVGDPITQLFLIAKVKGIVSWKVNPSMVGMLVSHDKSTLTFQSPETFKKKLY